MSFTVVFALTSIFFSSSFAANNLTYIFSAIPNSTVESLLTPTGLSFFTGAVSKRLSSSSNQILPSFNVLFSANNVKAIVFASISADCFYPQSFAENFPTKLVLAPVCSDENRLSTSNYFQLNVDTSQLAEAAAVFMRSHSLNHFSTIVTQIYSVWAQRFSESLTRSSIVHERTFFTSNLTLNSFSSLKTRVFYLIVSSNDELQIYSMISSSFLSLGNVIFVVVRWSHHFASFYSSAFSTNLTSISPTSFPVVHLLPVDYGISVTTDRLNNFTSVYDVLVHDNGSKTNFSDDFILIFNELESIDFINRFSASINVSTIFGSTTLGRNSQRLFEYFLIGRQCNGSWAILKTINSVLTNHDSNLCTYLFYPESDNVVTDDTAWRILRIVLFTLLGLLIVSSAGLIAFFVIRNQRNRKQMSKGPNKIILLPDDLMFVMPKGSIFTSKVNLKNEPHERSNVSIRSDEIQAGKTARYNGDLVEVKKLHIGPLSLRGKVMRELRLLKDMRHENVNAFIGLFIDPNAPALIFEYGQRGSLEDILKKEEIKLDWNFKWSMLNDLVRGMRYLSNSPIRCHGSLKSRNCIVDSRWVLKVTDFHLNETYALQNSPRQVDIVDLLWMSPEHIRTSIIKNEVATVLTSSSAGDVYSFGIIMQEVILRGAPFCMLDLSPQEIIAKIKKPPPLLRPSVSKQAAPPEYINSMKQCWAEQPETRPTFNDLAQSIKLLNGGKKVNIVDTMFKMLEQYSNNLEDLIRERTTQLEEEKKKTDKLLSQMLPPTVAESLKSGKAVEAVWYECVTIYFSDIVGFTTISALSSPMEVVDLLNDLYTLFDSILEDFDCYKVETIGDAYMVVSGLPIENGIKHASEIATMALTLLHSCGKFKIRHMPGVPLQVRIGLHSGACVAGVVGLKMPRYCLFGDTVNTASRMESTSMAYRIHCSESTAGLLQEIGGFQLECRGITEIKGRGNHKTYWLTGKDGFDKDLPEPVVSENNHGLDKELVRLAEEKARERERREKEIRANPTPSTTSQSEPVKTEVQVKTTTEKSKSKNDDLLRFTPPPAPENPTSSTNALPSKLQQMTGADEPARKSARQKW